MKAPPPPGAAARETLDAALLAAHAARDRVALACLYAKAADSAPGDGQRAFFLTHAYIFALDAGLPEAAQLHARLKALHCEA